MTPLSSARNLGPVSQRELAEIGVKWVEELFDNGWEDVLVRWCERFPARINVNAARSLVGAARGVRWDQIEPQDLERARELVLSMRAKQH